MTTSSYSHRLWENGDKIAGTCWMPEQLRAQWETLFQGNKAENHRVFNDRAFNVPQLCMCTHTHTHHFFRQRKKSNIITGKNVEQLENWSSHTLLLGAELARVTGRPIIYTGSRAYLYTLWFYTLAFDDHMKDKCPQQHNFAAQQLWTNKHLCH